MRYEPALDGLRSLAILGVLIFHVFPPALKGGFTGVDVFFVLSGYLIGSVILHDIRDGSFTMREFYLRRVQRLLPNAVVMVFTTLLLSRVALLPSTAAKQSSHAIWTLFNLSNVYIWRTVGGYWGEAAASLPLLHTWSLAVEEQFYLLFPGLLFLLSRRRGGWALPVTILIAVSSLALCLAGTWRHPVASFYLLPTRAWEPLLGAVLAVFKLPVKGDEPEKKFGKSTFLELSGWAGLLAILAGYFQISEGAGFPGFDGLIPTFGTLLALVSIAEGRTLLARLLALPPFVAVGKLSYSLYLWHWPFIVLARGYAQLMGWPERTAVIAGAGLGISLSVLAYFFVEAPLRSRGPGRSRRLLILASGFSVCALTGIGFSLGRPAADPAGVFETVSYRGQLYNTGGTGDSEWMKATIGYLDVQVPPPQGWAPNRWREGGIVHAWGGGTPRVVVLGSSHACMYGEVIDSVCRDLGVSVAFLAADGAPAFETDGAASFPSVELAREFYSSRTRWLREWAPDAVLVADRWDVIPPAAFASELGEFVRSLSPFCNRLVFLSQVPVLRIGQTVNLREFTTWQLSITGSLPRIAPDSMDAARRAASETISSVARENAKIRLVHVDRLFTQSDGSIRYYSGRKFLYANDNHLSDSGAQLAAALLRDEIGLATARSEPASTIATSSGTRLAGDVAPVPETWNDTKSRVEKVHR